jgi:molybdenum cofactor synthesis domain-containing protein
LAEDIFASEPMPPFAASTVDGYAVIAADASRRQIVGDQTAGYIADLQIQPGLAARIATGAPVPAGANAVVMLEYTEEHDGWLEVKTTVKPGDNIRPVGVDIEPGQRVLSARTVLNPAEIGLLATLGTPTVRVYPRPKIGVMSTGDELVEPDQTPQPGQIRDANRFTLMSVIRQTGGIPIDLGIVRDQKNKLAQTIERGLIQADGLLTSGGVSMGQLDLVKPYLAEHGALFFGRVKTKPGKPVTFGVLKEKPFFALPGFPVSALVSFENFVRPALLKMAGHTNLERPRRQVILAHDVRHNPDRTEFQRAVITRQPDGRLIASTTGPQGSGRLLSLHGANGLIILPHNQGDFPAGSVVEALLLAIIA